MNEKDELKIIGKPIPRHDAWEKAFGLTSYAADFSVPGMLYGKVLRSRHPSARILSINTSRAERLKGVKTVLTAKDVPKNESVTRFGQTHAIGGGFEGLYRVLADKKVLFLGEAVALVAAETEEIAEKALELIQVDYEPLPGIFDPIEAMKPDAPPVQEGRPNIITHYEVVKGDVEKGFSEADAIVENTYRVPFVDHAYLEPESGVAWIDENGVITIRVSTQVIEHFRGVADVLNLPHNRVRVTGTYVGGGFGGKEDITVESFLALLTYRTGRPVKLTYTREESILSHSKRHPYIMEYKTGAKKDGRLVALQAKLVSDAGAYVYLSPWVLLYSMVNAAGPYRIPHVRVDGYTVLTNNTFTSANRGFGAPQVCFAYESQMNELARKIGLEPRQIRMINYLEKGETLATGQLLEHHVALKETTERAIEALGKKESPSGKIKIGQGIASGMTSYGRMVFLHDTSRSHVSIEMDGSVTIRAGIQDIGGGQASSLCQITAETLGVPVEEIKIYIADTALTPFSGTTTATRQLYMSGNATLMAAREIRKILIKKAAEMMGIDPERLDLVDREVADKEGTGRSLSLKEVVKACASDGLPLYHVALFKAPFRNLTQFERIEGQVFPDFTFGTHGAEVAVDEETGRIQVLKLISSFDVGRAINRLSVEGQIEGGAIYGVGYGLTEEVILNKGITMTPSFSEYLLPTSMDVPDLETILIESGDGVGPFGAKGVGEPSVCSVAPAISNAVYDAIGVRIYDLPLTPEKIIKALKEE
ncbi:MAG: xanthine dehydrogenase family protein molybdopterin-binding subunit [Thermodesulfobacteriota bacterium]|nr:xanthine dehydrogenase family protein molybdopterin-binding subunit [Thermodesulfobacteriota bacterium]